MVAMRAPSLKPKGISTCRYPRQATINISVHTNLRSQRRLTNCSMKRNLTSLIYSSSMAIASQLCFRRKKQLTPTLTMKFTKNG
ncbi:hypothetical protein EMPG_16900 [Blastomyces silverae]|uniref:Uncharacterized protein n=1 Tax=Blastomyces silverae TaxID=2060906 RepID=A0A0H1B8A4_9EURO|nr:hypothetical protein EMPG_16900 [Blastomyces silverae]